MPIRLTAYGTWSEGDRIKGPEPAGYTTVTPWIATRDTGKQFELMCAAFKGEELALVPLEAGTVGPTEIHVGDTVLLAFDRPEWPRRRSMLRVFVEDADASMDRAVSAGARASRGRAGTPSANE